MSTGDIIHQQATPAISAICSRLAAGNRVSKTPDFAMAF